MLDLLAKASAIELVIWSIFIGITIGTFYLFYVKRILGAAVRRLLENGCTSPEKALTLTEIGCGKNPFIKSSIKSGILKNVITVVDRKEGIPPNFETAKLYVPEEKRIRSELRFSGKDTDIFGVIISVLVFTALAIALTRLVPYIITLIESFFEK